MRSSSGNNNGNRNRQGAGSARDARTKRSGRPRPEERRYDTGTGGGGGTSGGRGGAEAGRHGGGPSAGASDARSGPAKGAPAKGGPKGRSGQGPKGAPAKGGPAGGPAKGGPRSGSPQGGAKSGPKGGPAKGRGGAGPARSRELEAQIEERNRARHQRPARALPKTFPGAEQEGDRLQKVLARAGLGSRRSCEALIERRRVEVNGVVVTEQGLRVDPEKDEIRVDGLTVATQSYQFFVLNKPAGVVATMEDPDGRQCLGDYVTNRETRLFHVGRLDTETEGLILLTNHGELAHRLTHPRYGVTKTYLAAVQGPIPRDLGQRLRDGIALEDGFARADSFKIVQNVGKNYLVEVALHEGRKHIVRRLLAEAGFPVEKLVRTRFGPIALGDQKSGWLRRLTNPEVGMLMRDVDL